MQKDIDITFLFTILTSSLALWFYQYSFIIAFSTADRASISLIALGISHYLSFLCLLLAFVIAIHVCLEALFDKTEIRRFYKFEKIYEHSKNGLFLLWAPMCVFSLSLIISAPFFSETGSDFFYKGGALIVGIVFTSLFTVLFRIAIRPILNKMGIFTPILALTLFFLYLPLITFFSAEVKIKTEKEFYRADEIVRFSVVTSGYIFLPRIETVKFGFGDSLVPDSDFAYSIDPSKDYPLLSNSIIEAKFLPQLIPISQKRYLYVNRTKK